MPITLPPELETRVVALAASVQRDPEAVLAELVGTALDDDAELRAEVRAGIAELDAGKSVPHEEAMARLRRAIEQQSGPREQ